MTKKVPLDELSEVQMFNSYVVTLYLAFLIAKVDFLGSDEFIHLLKLCTSTIS